MYSWVRAYVSIEFSNTNWVLHVISHEDRLNKYNFIFTNQLRFSNIFLIHLEFKSYNNIYNKYEFTSPNFRFGNNLSFKFSHYLQM